MNDRREAAEDLVAGAKASFRGEQALPYDLQVLLAIYELQLEANEDQTRRHREAMEAVG